MNNLLSIVVPVYNVSKYLKECLDSISKQTFNDFEVILVNDGSTDNSLDILNEYSKIDNRFKVYTKSNGGLSSARNYGMQYVTGDYLTFLDSDDYLELNTYQEMMNNLIDNNNDLVVANIKYFFEDNREGYVLKGLNEDINEITSKKALLSPMFAWNKVYKTSYFKQINKTYPEGLWYEDIPVTTLLFTNTEKIGYVDKDLYHYRQRSTSIMGTKSSRNGEIFKILEIVINNFQERNIYDKYKDELEYLFLEHTKVYGQYRFLVQDNYQELYKQSEIFMKKYFPNYKNNKYIKYLNIKNKILLYTLNSYTMILYRKYLLRE